jgi:hypothetical protein
MRRAWKIALPVTCAVLIGGAMTFELVHRHHMEQQKLAQEAQAYRVRAEQGDAEAEYRLASMYNRGQGVPQELRRSVPLVSQGRRPETCGRRSTTSGIRTTTDMAWMGDFTRGASLVPPCRGPKASSGRNRNWHCVRGGQWSEARSRRGSALVSTGSRSGICRGRVQPRLAVCLWLRCRAGSCGGAEVDHQGSRSRLPACEADAGAKLACDQHGAKRLNFLGLWRGIFLLFPSRDPKQEPGSRIRRTTRFVGLGLVFSAALGLLSFTYVGILQPPLLVGALGFARNFVWGSLACILLPIVWHNSAKWALWASAVLFIAINGVVLAICFNRLKTEAAIRLLVSVNGSPLGLGITSAVLLLRAKRGGETSAPSGISSGIVT